ncbi:MAG: Hsp20/alpha crystallin family protein [Actinomycetota bacterium]|nr:Hsp20/alpha crystallin family protein [Actinomycetota bacterium]
MLLTSFDPFVQDFDKMVQRTLGWAENTAPRSVLPMDVIRHDEDVVLHIDLPGADPASIEVTADRGVLTVAARRSQEYGDSDRPVLRERVLGAFSRKIRLAETVDTEKIEATYDNGVLSILLPLQEKARPRKIEIKRSGAPEISA